MGATLIDRPSTALTQADIAIAGDLRYPRLAYMQGFLFGLTMSTAGASATLSVAAGNAVDSAGTAMMHLASAMAKTTAAWAAGTGNGGLDTGAIAINTWYHWFLIMNPTNGAVDVVFSLSATAPTLPTGFTLFRRIGSMKTNGSSQWVLFTQVDDYFYWSTLPVDVNTAAQSSTSITYTLGGIPTGVQVHALLNANCFATGAASSTLLRSLVMADVAVTFANANLRDPSTGGGIAEDLAPILTNTSAQIAARASTALSNLTVNTKGWIDTRGKLS